MLHQTLLTFRPFPSSSSSSSSSSTSYPPSYSSSINPLLSTNTSSSKVDMEVMKKDMFYYDSLHDNNNNNNNKGFLTEKVEEEEGCIPLPEEFQVDDLLDLRGLPESEEEEEEEEVMDVARVSFSNEKTFITASQNEPIEELYSEITLHETDAASLEWLSHFFDECSTEFPSPTPPSYIGIMSPSLTAHQAPLLNATTLIPVRAKRSKRLRGNGLLWCRNSQLRLPDSSSASSITTFSTTTTTTASPSSSSSSSSSFNSYISYEPSPFACFLLDDNSAIPKPNSNPKKRGRRPKNPFAIPAERRCSHCGVHKTPQWRAGPHGAKTLCNACGVRFKSGRLLPEYRPACSPTFVSHVHSNSHRKVLEMRRKKDEEVLIVTSAQPVSC